MDVKIFATPANIRKGSRYKLFNVPLAFLVVASILGLVLRYEQFAPHREVVYAHMLHAHSHVMFLGWVFNVLMLSFTIEFAEVRYFRPLFWTLQVCVAGMLISFPLQGYGAFSIAFSSLHSVGVLTFTLLFFHATNGMSSLSLTLAKTALSFFALSTLGPVALAYLKSHGLGHTDLYRFAVYFYLHFQYNGFFFFGILSLATHLVVGSLQQTELHRLRIACFIFIGACIPAFALSILWSKPTPVIYIVGFIAGIAQVVALYLLWMPLNRSIHQLKTTTSARTLLLISGISFVLKIILQLCSSSPAVAGLANEFRHIVIAYLHLVLMGFTTFFLFGWLIQKRVIPTKVSWEIGMLTIGFVFSEALLVVSPWSETLLNLTTVRLLQAVFFLSWLMAIGIISMAAKAHRQNS